MEGALIDGEKFVLGLGWTYTQRGTLIYGGKFVIGLLKHTEGGTYSWREVCVRFRMDLCTYHWLRSTPGILFSRSNKSPLKPRGMGLKCMTNAPPPGHKKPEYTVPLAL